MEIKNLFSFSASNDAIEKKMMELDNALKKEKEAREKAENELKELQNEVRKQHS